MSSQWSAAPPNPSPALLLCGGGTGGHVYPALAVAEALAALTRGPHGASSARQEKTNNYHLAAGESADLPIGVRQPSVVYVGSADGMEAGLVAKESSLPFRPISAAAIRGRNPLTLTRNALTLARGTQEAHRLIAELRPAAILGTGGYVCVPLFVAARMAGVPSIIYLPDVVPGLAIRFLSRLATVVACNVEDSLPYLGVTSNKQDVARRSSVVITGYPVRQELFDQEKAACRVAFGLDDTLPVVVVYGGSRGARSINQALAALLPSLLAQAQVIHVCGREGDETFLREAAGRLSAELQTRYKLFPYLHSGGARGEGSGNGAAQDTSYLALVPSPSMPQAFGAADLAVCRSGASTLAELPAAGLPAVLIPYPFVHQDENADYLVRRGAAVKVRDADMLGSGQPEDGPLFQNIQRLLSNHKERTRMSERCRALAKPGAARRLAALLLALATKTRTER